MSDIVIRAEGLGKKYLIGHEAAQTGDMTLRDTIMRGASRMRRSAGDIIRGRPLVVGDEVEEFWALKDLNFEIRRGEAVGIIGRNGAGKSTLLKVLSRITEPTEGRVTIDGRVASLLEVGTGFHPELSGRENIFLNGSILGMTRKEIQAKFDEILDFAGVEKFIDTPVKRYSSGMRVRLGFSVAAHLEPEILIVDEVLAVGDADFQKKCIGKMNDVTGEGRTVLFVSHNMAAIQALCNKGILLQSGNLSTHGEIAEVTKSYLSIHKSRSPAILPPMKERKGQGAIRFSSIAFPADMQTGAPVEILISLDSPVFHHAARISILLSDENERPVLLLSSELPTDTPSLKGGQIFSVSMEKLSLTPGDYIVTAFLEVNGQVCDWIENYSTVYVNNGDFYGSGKNLPEGWRRQIGLAPHIWRVIE